MRPQGLTLIPADVRRPRRPSMHWASHACQYTAPLSRMAHGRFAGWAPWAQPRRTVAVRRPVHLVHSQHRGAHGRRATYTPQACSNEPPWLRADFMTSYAASTMAHAGAARTARGPTPTNSARTPPSAATARSVPSTGCTHGSTIELGAPQNCWVS